MISALKRRGVLGINRRNADYTLAWNARRLYPLVDDKVLCKKRLLEHNLPVPDLIGVIELMQQTSHVTEIVGDYTEFVIKPAHGSGGDGIMVITGRQGDYFIDSDGKMVEQDTLEHHLTNVIGGLYSLGGQPDVAMLETLVHFDPAFSRLTGPANVLVMPAFHSASISTKLLQELGGATVIGPLLVGLDRPVQIVQLGAKDSNLVNMAALAAFNVNG